MTKTKLAVLTCMGTVSLFIASFWLWTSKKIEHRRYTRLKISVNKVITWIVSIDVVPFAAQMLRLLFSCYYFRRTFLRWTVVMRRGAFWITSVMWPTRSAVSVLHQVERWPTGLRTKWHQTTGFPTQKLLYVSPEGHFVACPIVTRL